MACSQPHPWSGHSDGITRALSGLVSWGGPGPACKPNLNKEQCFSGGGRGSVRGISYTKSSQQHFLNTPRIAALSLPGPLPQDLLSLEALIDLPWWAGSEATDKRPVCAHSLHLLDADSEVLVSGASMEEILEGSHTTAGPAGQTPLFRRGESWGSCRNGWAAREALPASLFSRPEDAFPSFLPLSIRPFSASSFALLSHTRFPPGWISLRHAIETSSGRPFFLQGATHSIQCDKATAVLFMTDCLHNNSRVASLINLNKSLFFFTKFASFILNIEFIQNKSYA